MIILHFLLGNAAMADNKFVYNARFVGRRAVDGPLNDFRLSEVVAAFQTEGNNKKTVQDEIRCNVEFSDKNLLITFIKKEIKCICGY